MIEQLTYRLDQFEGPLDLLLYLIRREELDIYDIPIEHITAEYMSFIEEARALDLDIAGEFIVMAATLMVIKSRMLLPVDRRNVSAEELRETAEILVDEINKHTDNLGVNAAGSSVMPYGYGKLSQKLVEAYSKVCDEHAFISRFPSRVKPVMLSEPWTYTHISGVYTYFTGEANINVNFPDYTLPFTAAHEMAHQRGIAREDEANFVAFLVCAASDDEYIRYSGYLNLYEYVSSALYSADKDAYAEVRAKLAPEARREMAAYSAFFDKYRENVAANVTETVNNTYLTMQGTPGTKSYGMVVDLAVAYLRDAK